MEDEKPDEETSDNIRMIKPTDHKMRPLGKPDDPKPMLGGIITRTPEPEAEKKETEIPPDATPESEFALGNEDGKLGRIPRSRSLKYGAGYEAGSAERKGKT
jgi:hypothetical protein